MLRFGMAPCLMEVLAKPPVREAEVTELLDLEREEDGTSPIADAQARRQDLHEKWTKEKKRFSDDDKTAYCAALKTVVRHRHLANRVFLSDHLRLHRLLMQVLSRLVDYSGLWERDLYFAALAWLHRAGEKPADAFAAKDAELRNGQIVEVLRAAPAKMQAGLARYFGPDFLDGRKGAAQIRNGLAHFNMLRDAPELNLTALVNDTRELAAYDRKLKNAVSKSIIELLHREGLALAWRMENHDLHSAKLEPRQATHLGDKLITENLHTDAFVDVAARLFSGTAARKDDIRSVDVKRIEWARPHREDAKGGEKKRRHRGKKRRHKHGFSPRDGRVSQP